MPSPAKSPRGVNVHTSRKSGRGVNVHTSPQPVPTEANVTRVGTVAQAAAVLGWGTGQGYQMADWSNQQGYVYFPELNTQREVTSYARGEGLRRARFLDANVGLAGRLLKGMGRMAMGTGLMPVSATRAKEWNKLANTRMAAVLGSAYTYDLAGRQDFYLGQADDKTTSYRDGDLGKAYARDEAGNLRVAYYEGHQIGGVPKGYSEAASTGAQIFDGVRLDRNSRRLSFMIQDGAQSGQAVEIDAGNFALLCGFNRKGSPRGVTILKHAINKMIRRGELEAMVTKGMMNAQRVGFALTRDVGAPPKPPGWNGGTGINPVRKENTVDATGTTKRVKIEDVIDSGGGEIPELPPGFDIKTLLDTRPHPNTMEFFDYIARDAAMGCDWPHELLYSIWKLGGANTRYVMADAQSVIEREQQAWVDQFGARDYIAFLAEEIRTGRLPKCPDPEWWAHEFIPPARMTVDFGRDGHLHLEMIRGGALTFKRFFGWQGLRLNQLDEWMDEVATVIEGCQSRGFGPEVQALVLECLYKRQGLGAAGAADAQNLDHPDDQNPAEDDPKDPTKDPAEDPAKK